MSFSENLRFIRKQKNISQEQLAEMLNVSRQSVSKWESGVGYPETEKLILLSSRLNVSIDYLLNETSNIEGKDDKTIVYVSGNSGRIAILSSDGESIVNCISVKSSKVISNKKEKEPKYTLLGVSDVSFWGEKSEILGWYKNIDDVQSEISSINLAIKDGHPNYELKYSCKIEYKGFFGQPQIIE